VKHKVMAAIIFLFLLAACDNPDNPGNTGNPGSPVNSDPNSPVAGDTYIAYAAGGPDVSGFIGRKWAREDSDFTWVFKNDGTVSVIHCCGEVYNRQFSYLFSGNVLITYGHETLSDVIEATAITMTESDTVVSFTRSNGIRFTQGDWDTGFPADSVLALSNDMLGVWQGEDGTRYEFSSDTGLLISTPLGDSWQYGYLVRYKVLLTFAPLIDGTQAVLRQYRFNRNGNKLYLRRSDDLHITLSRSE